MSPYTLEDARASLLCMHAALTEGCASDKCSIQPGFMRVQCTCTPERMASRLRVLAQLIENEGPVWVRLKENGCVQA